MSDLQKIATLVTERASDITVYIVDTKELAWGDADIVAQAPTLVVSPMPIKKFVPPRGRICQGFEFPKTAQYERLKVIGISVPEWAEIGPDTRLDPGEWGPYVVVKPDLGRKGAEIRIKRTERVRYKPEADYPEDHPARKAPMFAQKFVYTGRWPSNYRIVTLFGKTLMCWLCEADHGLPPLEERYAFGGGGVTIVSNKKTSHYSLASDQDVMALAEKTHAAFPDQPLLGTDVIRDAETGELFVLETVEVDLTDQALLLDVQLRFRALFDPLVFEAGWWVDDLRVEDVWTFGTCRSGCDGAGPSPRLLDVELCGTPGMPTVVLLDGSSSLPGVNGWPSELPLIFTHDGPGHFDGARFAAGEMVELTFPPGTPAGIYPVTLTARDSIGCTNQITTTVSLFSGLPPAERPGDSLRVSRLHDEITFRWMPTGEPLAVHVHDVASTVTLIAPRELTTEPSVTWFDEELPRLTFVRLQAIDSCGVSVP
ncbi:MAG: hypothetical protein AAF533_04310 [Acidobacteriota bacterium]